MSRGLDYRANSGTPTPAILQRITKMDKSAVEDCIDTYGNLVWALAKRCTNSSKEAEDAVVKIFKEIWQCAEQYDSAKCSEEKYILKVAVRHLLRQSVLKS